MGRMGGAWGWAAVMAVAIAVVSCGTRAGPYAVTSGANSQPGAPAIAPAVVSARGTAAAGAAAPEARPTAPPAPTSTEVLPTEVPPTEVPPTATSVPAAAALPLAPVAPRPPAGPAGGAGWRPIVVQIDNAVPARPPLHLSEADVVYEYVAEGGVTRFSALFTKEDVGVVGPLRSARLASLEIARQFEALLLYHGASIGVQERIYNGGIYYVSFARADTFPLETRLRDRPAPHNSTTTLPLVRRYAAEKKGVPPRVDSWPDFPRGAAPAPDQGQPVGRVSVRFGDPSGAAWPDYRADFAYVPEAGRYVRTVGGQPHVDGATGAPIGAETVVVQVVPAVVTDIVEDVLGSRSLDYQMQGEGKAYFYRNGTRWEGRWSRPGPFEPTSYLGPGGEPFPFGDGSIWIAIVAPNTAVVNQP